MTHRPLLALLEDSVDKELSQEESAELRRLLEGSEDLRADLAASVRLKELLRQLAVPDPGTAYYDELRELVLARTTGTAVSEPWQRVSPTAPPVDERGMFVRSLASAVASIFLFFAAIFLGSQSQWSIVSLTGKHDRLMTAAVAQRLEQPEFALVTQAERDRISQGMFLLSPPGLGSYLITGMPNVIRP
jgi:anti-sigma factor RsiW